MKPDAATGELYDPVTGARPEADEVYSFNKQKGLEPFLNKWVPVPYLRVLGKDEQSNDVFDRGPTNWARVRVVELDERDRDGNTHRVVVAFDTEIRNREDNRPYLVASPRDSAEEQEFRYVSDESHNHWFLSEPWVEEWLEEILREYKQALRGDRPLRAEDFPYVCEHWARYLTFLNLIELACRLPRIKLADIVSEETRYVPIDVDLVLDIGNSRTCGILIESNPDERLDLNNSYMLELRDLTRPERAYALPFESRVEFARASFGKDHISRHSGRANGFYWPSLVRTGPEAARLSGEAQGTEGTTGLSSPKRYLWDDRPLNQVWRFNGMGQDGVTTEPPVSGAIMAHVTEEGDIIRQRRRGGSSAVRAKFSRSSLFSFMLSEIILQAQLMINSPETRSQRRHADIPRQLRRIILTLPPATPLAEQRIMRRRAEGAVKLTWDALGWSSSDRAPAPEPQVILNWDEASCTQLVYLYTEITQKFQGAANDFFEIMGRPRADYGFESSLRVASIDIGGGTTDLMVTTYQVEGKPGDQSDPEFPRRVQDRRRRHSAGGDRARSPAADRTAIGGMRHPRCQCVAAAPVRRRPGRHAGAGTSPAQAVRHPGLHADRAGDAPCLRRCRRVRWPSARGPGLRHLLLGRISSVAADRRLSGAKGPGRRRPRVPTCATSYSRSISTPSPRLCKRSWGPRCSICAR